MSQIALHWWPRSSSRGTTTATGSSSSLSNCCGLSRLMRRLKKQRSKMLQQQSSRQSLQCRYDPLSYSLNFDTTASGDFVDDDYYKYYAFSSRFVALAAPTNHCQRLPLTA